MVEAVKTQEEGREGFKTTIQSDQGILSVRELSPADRERQKIITNQQEELVKSEKQHRDERVYALMNMPRAMRRKIGREHKVRIPGIDIQSLKK